MFNKEKEEEEERLKKQKINFFLKKRIIIGMLQYNLWYLPNNVQFDDPSLLDKEADEWLYYNRI
tara:strand:- start:2212 stop:2403 length:192 start_codon:yes stop_codon:yes gene_type:complete